MLACFKLRAFTDSRDAWRWGTWSCCFSRSGRGERPPFLESCQIRFASKETSNMRIFSIMLQISTCWRNSPTWELRKVGRSIWNHNPIKECWSSTTRSPGASPRAWRRTSAWPWSARRPAVGRNWCWCCTGSASTRRSCCSRLWPDRPSHQRQPTAAGLWGDTKRDWALLSCSSKDEDHRSFNSLVA